MTTAEVAAKAAAIVRKFKCRCRRKACKEFASHLEVIAKQIELLACLK